MRNEKRGPKVVGACGQAIHAIGVVAVDNIVCFVVCTTPWELSPTYAIYGMMNDEIKVSHYYK